MIKIIVLGKSGQLASELKSLKSYDQNWSFLSIGELNICDKDAVSTYFKSNPCEVLINCALYTAVDKAEEEKKACFNVNLNGIENLLEAIQEKSVRLLHISTDYVLMVKNQTLIMRQILPHLMEYMENPKLLLKKL